MAELGRGPSGFRKRRRPRRTAAGGRFVSRYDPSEPIGKGRTIIEASAGTGKTFTIAAAVTRLVAEEDLSLEEILVVTFTRAAAAELKDRIRRRMVGTLRCLRVAGAAADDHMALLAGAGPGERDLYSERLDEAVTRFDGAQIFTIDAFAFRLLRRLGFRSRLAPDLEPGEIDDLLIRQAASDLVVANFAGSGPELPAGGGAAAAPKIDELAAVGKKLADIPDARIVPDRPLPGEFGPPLRTELARLMRRLLTQRLRAARAATFSDSLVEARAALTGPEIGAAARELLQRIYSIALVDESQDTDPIQWEIIRAVFDDTRLVVIGDPKQAIYAFRGADIESYLAAAEGADAVRTLDTNWRSDGPLIKALDALFTDASFGDERIAYMKVSPAPRRRSSRIAGAGAPLQIRRFSDDYPLPSYQRRNRSFFRVGPAREAVAADAAAESVRLLTSGVTLEEEGRPRPLEPGDIAVLCRTRRQVDLVREHLDRCGVPSVAARTGGVFATPAAEAWRRFLLAVERPNRTDYVCMGAASALVGLTMREVADLREEEALAWQQRFFGWRSVLYRRGVPAMLEDVDRTTGLTARVLAERGGERMLTDLAHIAEELHAAWRRRRIGSPAAWIEAAMDEADRNAAANVEDPESRQRRLETDAAAVQVRTIHGVKGLEYPVVLAPFLWDIWHRPPPVPVFHDPAPAPPGQPRPRLIDVGGPDLEDHQEAAMAEEADEEARLLYVALTRARHHLVVWFIHQTAGAPATKLHHLMTGRSEESIGASIEDLVEASGGAVSQTAVSAPAEQPVDYRARRAGPVPLELAGLDRPLDYDWRRVSFSSLSPGRPLAGHLDTAEEPDRVDETADAAPAPEAAPAAEEGAGRLLMADLPRGPRFGSLVHEVLQEVPFDSPDLAAAVLAELSRNARSASWDFDRRAFAEGLAAALQTPLGPDGGDPALCSVDPARTLKEMDFELPLRTSGGSLSIVDVAAAALDRLPEDDPHRSYFALLRDLDPVPFRGYMTGSIDFTAALPGGPGGARYLVMDFKSNSLPPLGRAPAPADYGPGPLAAAMHHGNYLLQALLYQVALHRYLQWRLDGYRPEVHLGGSMYLFVRGMTGPGAPVVEGERCGVARWRPPPEMIAAVSRLFAGEGES